MTGHHHGGCACKHLRYRLTAEPMFVHVCHCNRCQAQTGTAFVTQVFIERAALELLSGTLKVTDEATEEDGARTAGHRMHRCATCLAPIFSVYGGNDLLAVVKGGTLEDLDAFPPGAHLWVENRVPWITLPEDTPSFAQNYSPAEVWPKAALARRIAIGWG